MSLWKGKRVEDPGTDLATVEGLLRKAIELDDSLAEAHVQLGDLYADERKYKESIPQYLRALELDPNLADAYYRLGTDYVHTGEKDKAQKEFAIYQKLRAEHLAEVEKERAEVQQFVYSEKSDRRAGPERRVEAAIALASEAMDRSWFRERYGNGGPAADAGLLVGRLARALSQSRREFLRGAAGLAIGSALMGASPFLHGGADPQKTKVIVITFGGGARDQETFAPEGPGKHPPHDAGADPAVQLLLPCRRTEESSATTWRPPAWPRASTKRSIISLRFLRNTRRFSSIFATI